MLQVSNINKYKIEGLIVFRPLNGKQKLPALCELCASAVKNLFRCGFARDRSEYPL
jgi:hypothetical protein